MTSLLSEFNEALVDYDYKRYESPCMFDPERERFEELCHLISRSEANINMIKKVYNCSEKDANYIIDVPLLNVVCGSKKWNGTGQLTHKVGTVSDISVIPKAVGVASLVVLSNNKNLLKVDIIYDWVCSLYDWLETKPDRIFSDCFCDVTDYIKKFQKKLI